MFEALSRCDPVAPRTEQLWVIKPFYLPVNNQKDLLEYVLRHLRIADHVFDISVERRLHILEEFVECGSVTCLRPQHEKNLFIVVHESDHPNIMREKSGKLFEFIFDDIRQSSCRY